VQTYIENSTLAMELGVDAARNDPAVRLFSLREALRSTPSPGNLAAEIANFRGLDVEFCQPKGSDAQKPHARDEIYVIARGSGGFESGGKRHEFSAGDAIYVPRHAEHRFVDFSEDFATWVFFWP
jgi:mannose-6-phosphate isomerase-like protein (cupin superfamily)